MERSEGEKWSEKKRNLWRPGVFSLFSGMFHLVKASEWEGTCVPCWSEWFGDFSRGVCRWPKALRVRMIVRCVSEYQRVSWDFLGALGKILQWNCSIAMTGRGGVFLVFVCESPPTNFLPHWATESYCFCGRVWSTTHMHACSCRNTHTWGMNEWMAGPDYHTGLLLMTSLLGIWSLHPFHVSESHSVSVNCTMALSQTWRLLLIFK